MAKQELPFADIPTPTLREALGYAGRALALVWRSAPVLTLTLALVTVLIAMGPALAAYIGKLIIDSILAAIESSSRADQQLALIWVVAEAGVLGGLLALRRLQVFQKRVLQAQLGFAVGRLIFAKTLALDLETIENPTVQQQVLLARQHASARPFSLVSGLFDAAQYLISILTFAAVLWLFSPWAVLIVLVGGLPLFVGELRFSADVFRLYTGRTPEMRQRNYLEGLMLSEGAAMERIHSGANPAIEERHLTLYNWIFGQDRALQMRRTWVGIGLIWISSAIFMGGKLWVVWATVLGTITLGQMTMYAALLKQGQNTVTSLLATLTTAYEDLLYVSNLYTLLGIDEGAPRGTATEGPVPGDGYRLEQVGFSYVNGTRPALTDVSLHIPPGTRLGIVGVNGSGKTTFVKLLMGLYKPQSGRITLDGLPLEDWSPAALHARTAALFQPFQRYSFTLGENIAMGEGLRVTDPELLTAAAQRGLAGPLLEELPEGLDTRLSRQFLDGRELSGGQWQRVALARALLRTGADTLILDEPTSALDPEAEAALIEEAAAPGRTTILISHRLSNLRRADRIIVLAKGHIVESGTHEELMTLGGIYRSMFDSQAGFYKKGS